jgi:hypothetical protein
MASRIASKSATLRSPAVPVMLLTSRIHVLSQVRSQKDLIARQSVARSVRESELNVLRDC